MLRMCSLSSTEPVGHMWHTCAGLVGCPGNKLLSLQILSSLQLSSLVCQPPCIVPPVYNDVMGGNVTLFKSTSP